MTIKEMVQYYLCAKINNPRTEENYLSISRRFNECCPHSSIIQEIDFMHIKKPKPTGKIQY